MRCLTYLLVAFPALASYSCQKAPAPPPPIQTTYSEPKLAVKLSDPDINESSGLARSHANPGWYYTHNDSGDTARYWKFDLSGKTVGPLHVPGAEAIDWEDMASAKFGSASNLYFADIGDNAERRPSVQVYMIREPDPSIDKPAKAERFDLSYPDKPHNAEAFLVHPSSGEFTIVTKTSKGPAEIFVLKGGTKARKHTLIRTGTVEVGSGIDAAKLITGGDFSPDGKYVVLRTYLAAYEFDVPADGAWWRSKPRIIQTASEVQGEAIAYSLDGSELITTSEYAPCPVSKVAVARR